MMCFECVKEIETGQEKTMLGLDVPYINLWFHKSCFIMYVKNDINAYLTSKMNVCGTIIENYLEKPAKIRKNKDG